MFGERADVVGHEIGTGGAVQSDGEQVGVRHRSVERVDGLAGEHRAHRSMVPETITGISQAEFLAHAIDAEQRRL